jgi:hypothetical protein
VNGVGWIACQVVLVAHKMRVQVSVCSCQLRCPFFSLSCQRRHIFVVLGPLASGFDPLDILPRLERLRDEAS